MNLLDALVAALLSDYSRIIVVRKVFLLGMAAVVQYPYLGSRPFVWIYLLFSINLLGQICLLFLLGTLLFSNEVHPRKVHLINLLVATVIYGIGPWFLVYSGQLQDPTPGWGYCLFTASFKHGGDTMVITATLALTIELFATTRKISTSASRTERLRTYVLAFLPYFTFVLWMLITVAVGVITPSRVQHQDNRYYCVISSAWLGSSVEIYAVACDLVVIALEVYP
ncbi:hypothetical protein OE88DRAFT_800066 [Heliocybe sulcata]|uniref:G-protein coupled receptors family 1 profile domain-containing protein n=1 Tax=Heliocybe sulcata TaxID=5364 RepID=A0A5C3MQ31_9AGAM|nr:hypothetical protein OE88DRAFT_800066 [Heliocybe sulcata]